MNRAGTSRLRSRINRLSGVISGVTRDEDESIVALRQRHIERPRRRVVEFASLERSIPPVDEEPALHFALLAKMAARNGLAKVSMGMSADYETAVRQGATHVRVGSALFGARHT